MKINRSYCNHRNDKSKRVEFFWSEPVDNSYQYPLILMVHGHNDGLRYGARTEFLTGLFEYFSDNGFVVAAISQPGYGNSCGPADYCGPFSQEAVSSVLDFFDDKAFIDPNRVVGYGVSRGATVVGMTSTFDMRIKYAVLVAGLHNIRDGIEKLNDGIRESLKIETKNVPDAFFLRSPSLNVDKINIPVLVIHGEKDSVAPFKYAKEFVEEGLKLNKNYKSKFFSDYEHGIPFSLCGELTLNFLKEHDVFRNEEVSSFILKFK